MRKISKLMVFKNYLILNLLLINLVSCAPNSSKQQAPANEQSKALPQQTNSQDQKSVNTENSYSENDSEDLTVLLYDDTTTLNLAPVNSNSSSDEDPTVHIIPQTQENSSDTSLNNYVQSFENMNWYVVASHEGADEENLNLTKFSIKKFDLSAIFNIFKRKKQRVNTSNIDIRSLTRPTSIKPPRTDSVGSIQIRGSVVDDTVMPGSKTKKIFDDLGVPHDTSPMELAKAIKAKRKSFDSADNDSVEALNTSLSGSKKVFNMSKELIEDSTKTISTAQRTAKDVDITQFKSKQELDDYINTNYQKELEIFEKYGLAIESSKAFQMRRQSLIDTTRSHFSNALPIYKNNFDDVQQAFKDGIAQGKKGKDLEDFVIESFVNKRFPDKSIIGNEAITGVRNQMRKYLQEEEPPLTKQFQQINDIEVYLAKQVDPLEGAMVNFLKKEGHFSNSELAILAYKFQRGDQTAYARIAELMNKRGDAMDSHFDHLFSIPGVKADL